MIGDQLIVLNPDMLIVNAPLSSWTTRALVDGLGSWVGVGRQLLLIKDLGLVPGEKLEEVLGFRTRAINEVRNLAQRAGVELQLDQLDIKGGA